MDNIIDKAEHSKVFISYSRSDQQFVDRLQASLESCGFQTFVDRKDIAKGEEFWSRIQDLITQADVVVFVVSEKSISSSICKRELDLTHTLGKRIVPLIWETIAGTLPSPLSELNWVSAEDCQRSGLNDEVPFKPMLANLQCAIDLGDVLWIREHTKWVARAVDWNTQGRRDVNVLRAGDITAVQAWLSRRPKNDSPAVPEVLESFLGASVERERRDRRRTNRLQAFIGAAIAIALVVLLIGGISVLRLISGIGARTSKTLTELALREFEANDFESAARYSLAGMNGADSLLVGYDDAGARAILEAAVLNNRLTRIVAGHRGAIEMLLISPDGRVLLTTAEDATVQLWDATSGALMCVLPIYDKPSLSCGASKQIKGIETNTAGPEDENPTLAEFSPRGDVIFTAKGTIARLWNATTGSLLFQMDHPNSDEIAGIQSISISPNGQLLATGSLDQVVRLWSAKTGTLVHEFKENRDYVRHVRFSPDGQSLLAVGNDGMIRMWDTNSGTLQRSIDTQSGRLFFGAFSPNGDRFLAIGDDSYARVWQTGTGTLLYALTGSYGRISSASFSPDGKALITVSADGSANLWDATGKISQTYVGQIYSAKFSVDGAHVLTLGRDRAARVWNTYQGTLIDSFVGNEAANDAAFLPDHMHIVTAGDDGSFRTWSLSVGAPKLRLNHGGTIASVRLSSDGSRIMTAGGQTATARIWDGNTGKLLKELSGHKKPIASTYLSPNGRRLVTASQDGAIFLWDTESGQLQKVFSGADPDVTAVAVSPDGSYLAAISLGKDGASDNWHCSTQIWNLATSKLLLHVREKYVNGVAFSPDSRVLLVAASSALNFYNLSSGVLLRSIPRTSSIVAVKFSATGKLIVTSGGQVVHWLAGDGGILLGSTNNDVNATDVSEDDRYGLTAHNDGIARLWDLETGKLLQTFVGHKDRLTVARFLHDGKHIVTGSNDQTVRLWDIRSGKPLMVLRGHATTITDIAFSQDQTLFVTQGVGDDFALLWANPLQSLTKSNIGYSDIRYSACQRLLLHGSDTNLAILSSEELSSAPEVDPVRDFKILGDVCEPISSWQRFIAAFRG